MSRWAQRGRGGLADVQAAGHACNEVPRRDQNRDATVRERTAAFDCESGVDGERAVSIRARAGNGKASADARSSDAPWLRVGDGLSPTFHRVGATVRSLAVASLFLVACAGSPQLWV